MENFATPAGIRTAAVIGTYADYADAQRLVDHLSDKGFPVQHVRIVGRGLHSVEQVIGRLTSVRAALSGAMSGALFGLLMGWLLGIFVKDTAFWKPLLLGAVFGAVWGAVTGFVGHAATKGARDFTSVSAMRADHYEVEVDAAKADDARALAAQLVQKLPGVQLS